MTQTPGGQTPPISPDGQYYWDGTAWRPRAQQPAPAQPAAAPLHPQQSGAPTNPYAGAAPANPYGSAAPANPYAQSGAAPQAPSWDGGQQQQPQQWGDAPQQPQQWGGGQQQQQQWGGAPQTGFGQSQQAGSSGGGGQGAGGVNELLPRIGVGVGGVVLGIGAIVIHQILIGILIIIIAGAVVAKLSGLIDK